MGYLTETNLITINAYLIQRYSPGEDIGVKESGALNMCVQSVHATVFGEEVYPTLIEKAMILFINIVKKHCFYNGNKRTAYHALDTFLMMNEREMMLNETDIVELCVLVATWEEDFDELKEHVLSVIEENSRSVT